jgi:hypothetical protein
VPAESTLPETDLDYLASLEERLEIAVGQGGAVWYKECGLHVRATMEGEP